MNVIQYGSIKSHSSTFDFTIKQVKLILHISDEDRLTTVRYLHGQGITAQNVEVFSISKRSIFAATIGVWIVFSSKVVTFFT